MDGPGYYGGNCGGFAGGTQMAGSAPQPEKAQEHQQQQEMPTGLAAQQQLLQIGEQQLSSYDQWWPVENALLGTILPRFLLSLH